MAVTVRNASVESVNECAEVIGKHFSDKGLKHIYTVACGGSKAGLFPMFYLPENADAIQLEDYDYVVDCIDTVKAKLHLVRRCHQLQKPFICSMGAANKLDPTAFRVSDISKTANDPLARVLRKTLRREGIEHFKVVYSEELPVRTVADTLPSCAFVPAAAGLVVGGEVVKDLAKPYL